jgi:hypothetical protein
VRPAHAPSPSLPPAWPSPTSRSASPAFPSSSAAQPSRPLHLSFLAQRPNSLPLSFPLPLSPSGGTRLSNPSPISRLAQTRAQIRPQHVAPVPPLEPHVEAPLINRRRPALLTPRQPAAAAPYPSSPNPSSQRHLHPRVWKRCHLAAPPPLHHPRPLPKLHVEVRIATGLSPSSPCLLPTTITCRSKGTVRHCHARASSRRTSLSTSPLRSPSHAPSPRTFSRAKPSRKSVFFPSETEPETHYYITPASSTAGAQRRHPEPPTAPGRSIYIRRPKSDLPRVNRAHTDQTLGHFVKESLNFIRINPHSTAVQKYLQADPFSSVLASIFF